ncbi:MAG: PIN domain-containing protein [Candidatus Korarchaeota archaeon]|nr:PIN domain-containing protein [Candidatus Korarchaeota archaeon]
MARISRGGRSGELLLDTTYLLPYLGIRVGVGPTRLDVILRSHRPLYPALMLAELEGVLYKVGRERGMDRLPRAALDGFNSVVHGALVELVPPTDEDLEIAYRVISAGWSDLYDAALYATAERLDAPALTLDGRFKEFLRRRGFNHRKLVSHRELTR